VDCVDTGFLTDGTLDELPRPSHVGAIRVGGIDLNKPRMHAALSAVLALATTAGGFTVGQLTAKVHAMTGNTGYTLRQAAYDLRKIRGKRLIEKLGRSHRYHLPAEAARTITALLTLRDQVIAPILAGVRSPRMGRKPKTWTAIDRHYEQIPHQPTDPLRTPRPQHRGIDNILSIGELQAARRRGGRPEGCRRWPR
jgi:hypothetical protein